LPGAEAAVAAAHAAGARVLLITKGDLLDQERKLAQSGLGDHFHAVEIVSDKTPHVYTRIFDRHGAGAARGLMVGNSLKSDVIPAIAAGGWGVHVPHEVTWELEAADAPDADPRFRRIADLGQLAALVAEIG
jgi:putative hydrolase of the HAD superfamily